jgi:hypothetical protein
VSAEYDRASRDNGSLSGRAPSGSTLVRLRELLLEEGGLMRGLVPGELEGKELNETAEAVAFKAGGSSSDGPRPGSGSWPGSGPRPGSDGPWPGVNPAQLAASGPRVDGQAADYELLIETIYEGYLLHYHAPRVVRVPEEDLGLLAGDRLYALGLARLVKLGDVEAVAELADVITLSALAHGAGKPELAAAVWVAGAHAVGWGASPGHEHAKALTRAGSPDALEAMRGVIDD